MRDGEMCFGRNMDLFYDFGERVIITPRSYPLPYLEDEKKSAHYAMIGMGTLEDGYDCPLYADAMNECGLCMAGLDFPGNAVYREDTPQGEVGVAPYELIPLVLGSCRSVDDAVDLAENVMLVDRAVSPRVGTTPLHWMLADVERTVVLEPMAEGLRIYDDPLDVLTNAPPFDFHLQNVKQYAALDSRYKIGGDELFAPFSYGFGALGLPGDASSASRFVRAEFMLRHCGGGCTDEYSRVMQCMDILSSVAMVKGSVLTPDGRADMTVYSACMMPRSGRYYFRLHSDCRLAYAELTRADAEGSELKELALPLPSEPLKL